jgi:predicted permease
MSSFLHDLRHAVRLLFKDRLFSVTAILTLGVAAAANALVFCIVNSVLLRPLPFDESDRIVLLHNSYPKAGAARASTGVPDYYDRRRETTAFEEQALYRTTGQTLGVAGEAERVMGIVATPSMFRLLRVQAFRGRTFTPEEGEPGNERKVILSHALWQRLFAGRDSAVGEPLRLSGMPHTIVGVLPPDFRFLDTEAELWIPAAFRPEDRADDQRHSNNWTMLARLKTDASVALAQQQIDALNARNLDRFPEFRQIIIDAGFHTVVEPLQESLVADVRRTLYLLWAGALFVLLIGGVNVANLVLARASARLKELATRHVLGANLGRLARQLVTETTLLAACGGAFGLLLGHWAVRFVARLDMERLRRSGEIVVDPTAVVYTVGLALAVGLLAGLVPIVRLRQASLAEAFREEGRTGTASRSARLLRQGLVTVQVAFALVLLVGAALLLVSFQRVLAVDPGFTADGVVTGMVTLPASRYAGDVQLASYAARALERLRALPGAKTVGMTSSLPFGGSFSDGVLLPEGFEPTPGESLISPARSSITPGYLEALEVRLVRGRLFTDADGPSAQRVVIVDDRLARRFWPNEDPIGKRLVQPDNVKDIFHPSPRAPRYTVVGVVGTVKMQGLVNSDERFGALYFAAAQRPPRLLFLTLTSEQDPTRLLPSVRRALAGIDAEVPLYSVRTLTERMEQALVSRRAPMLLALAFGIVALFLAAVGLYGVLSYQVAQRRREIGIRMALGGDARSIFGLVVREGMLLALLGGIAGLAGAFALARTLESQLYDVRATDPRVLAAVVGILALVALAACLVPARRASRVDPVVALTDL